MAIVNPTTFIPAQAGKPAGSVGQTTPGNNWWSSMSPQVQAALVSGGIGIGGGLLAGYGQSKQNEQNNAANAEQAELQRQLQLYLAQMDQGQRQAEQGVQAQQSAPSRQDWRQRQAIMGDVMPQLRNVSIGAPQDLQRFMPQVNGGLRLPEGGLSQSALSFFSPEARVNAEADLDKAGALASGGRAPTPNYGGVGYGQAGQQPGQQVTDYAAEIRKQQPQPGQMPPALNNAANRLTQTQTQAQRAPQQAQQPQSNPMQSPWLQMALAAAGGYLAKR